MVNFFKLFLFALLSFVARTVATVIVIATRIVVVVTMQLPHLCLKSCRRTCHTPTHTHTPIDQHVAALKPASSVSSCNPLRAHADSCFRLASDFHGSHSLSFAYILHLCKDAGLRRVCVLSQLPLSCCSSAPPQYSIQKTKWSAACSPNKRQSSCYAHCKSLNFCVLCGFSVTFL